MMVSHKLSILKSVLWRIMGVIILASVTYFYTRQWIITTYITLIHHATFLLVFYLHERFWFNLSKPCGIARKICKALLYEIVLGMGIGGLIVFLITGSWTRVTEITLTYTAIKLIVYFLNEVLWNKYIEKIGK